MGVFFTAGEKKKRAGVYQRYENTGTTGSVGSVNGMCAITYQGDWGPLGQVIVLESADDVRNKLGLGGVNGTVSAILELFAGGATKVYAVRIGTGGTKGNVKLKDTTSASAKDAITLTLKHEGDRAFTFVIREVLGNIAAHELVLFENNVVKEKFSYNVSETEVDDLIALINRDSAYLTAAKEVAYTGGTNKLALVGNGTITAGTNPTVTNESYSAGFIKLEPYRWNTICVDKNDVAVHQLLVAYMNRVYQDGKMAFAVVGEPTSVEIATRMQHAKAFNDYNVIYVGGGWEDLTGTKIEGVKAVARIAGMVASTPSNQSITHKPIAGAIKPLELLTNSQYEQAVDNGMITFSVSSHGVVWIDNGITTLVTATAEDDEGWKKIKRAKIRFEVMTRTNDTVEPLIGKILNNSDGRSNIIQAVQGLLNDMVSEGKLMSGATVELDTAQIAASDSAWFNIYADDIDSLEKIYFAFKFRFSPSQA